MLNDGVCICVEEPVRTTGLPLKVLDAVEMTGVEVAQKVDEIYPSMSVATIVVVPIRLALTIFVPTTGYAEVEPVHALEEAWAALPKLKMPLVVVAPSGAPATAVSSTYFFGAN